MGIKDAYVGEKAQFIVDSKEQPVPLSVSTMGFFFLMEA